MFGIGGPGHSISDHSDFTGYCAQAWIERSQGNNLPKMFLEETGITTMP